MKEFIRWVVVSSADPKKTSLMVRGFLLGLVPATLSLISALCGFGLFCIGIDSYGLNQLVESLTEVIQLVLTAVASMWMAWGLIRKVYLTHFK